MSSLLVVSRYAKEHGMTYGQVSQALDLGQLTDNDICAWYAKTYGKERKASSEKYKYCRTFDEIDGEVRSRKEWCDIYGVSYNAVMARINKKGMTLEQALKQEVQTKRGHSQKYR